MRQSTTLVVYKDSKDAAVRYFGPFINLDFASEFATALPEPLQPGGFKGYRSTQPFTSTETSLATEAILSDRETGHNRANVALHEAI
jgi:hypothetical protein